MEAKHCFGVDLKGAIALSARDESLWEAYRRFVDLHTAARCEKWVPFHTALGAHDRFIIEEIHQAREPVWNEKRRFLVMFIFRAHCCREMFDEAQLHLLRDESFWANPRKCFAIGGPMEKSIIAYRRRTSLPLQTSAFRIIPRYLCADKDVNLARNICLRSAALLTAAEDILPRVLGAKKMVQTCRGGGGASAAIKRAPSLFEEISSIIRRVEGVAGTWVKMLMVCIDLRYPELRLLRRRCEVGIGAERGLERLVPNGLDVEGARQPPQEQLALLTSELNASKKRGLYRNFWTLLHEAERVARQHCSGPKDLLHRHLRDSSKGLSAATVQVQLCEWRQFLDFMARSRSISGLGSKLTAAALNGTAQAGEDIAIRDSFGPSVRGSRGSASASSSAVRCADGCSSSRGASGRLASSSSASGVRCGANSSFGVAGSSTLIFEGVSPRRKCSAGSGRENSRDAGSGRCLPKSRGCSDDGSAGRSTGRARSSGNAMRGRQPTGRPRGRPRKYPVDDEPNVERVFPSCVTIGDEADRAVAACHARVMARWRGRNAPSAVKEEEEVDVPKKAAAAKSGARGRITSNRGRPPAMKPAGRKRKRSPTKGGRPKSVVRTGPAMKPLRCKPACATPGPEPVQTEKGLKAARQKAARAEGLAVYTTAQVSSKAAEVAAKKALGERRSKTSMEAVAKAVKDAVAVAVRQALQQRPTSPAIHGRAGAGASSKSRSRSRGTTPAPKRARSQSR
eukprot:TRINITY_DN68083_c0_g1_i1.p1 TRINITY_DN68083_c0_g1~~TRINITY_DN68083_c0_g1_i1.p1  ORF type:complete len:832 (+),score=143.91 TRINITY_DN68083_c0_g1_i1:285-2498(+)